jgi:NAD(P)-dependent dehydrogenase (short-subunit alcohol dehydrogenase family)
MELSGKHVVITGAASGIGAGLAERFHAEGANVVAADRDGDGAAATAAKLEAARPDSAFAVTTDVGSEAGNVALIEAASERFGPIDLFFAPVIKSCIPSPSAALVPDTSGKRTNPS